MAKNVNLSSSATVQFMEQVFPFTLGGNDGPKDLTTRPLHLAHHAMHLLLL